MKRLRTDIPFYICTTLSQPVLGSPKCYSIHMNELAKVASSSLLERTRSVADLSEDDQRRFAAEAARDRDAAALWALTEAYLTLHGAAGARVSVRTLSAYRHAVEVLIADWASENLLRPGRNAGVLWVRELEGRKPVKGKNDTMTPATVRGYVAAAKALYAALRWSGATDAAPFADVKVAADKTPAWEKREAYTNTEVTWLERCSEGATLLIVLLGAHAGLRVSEMTALKWEHVNLGEGVLKVVDGKGGKTARVYVTPTLVQALEITPVEQRTGYVLPCRSRQVVYGRLEAACRQARVTFKGVHALRHASGTRLREDTGDLALVADHLRHSSLDTARGYAKADNRQLKKALGEW
jgi:integrase/recombinase XerC